MLLLDEPLSALDAKLREAMQLELVRLQQSVGITFVIVTHDQDEALSMANRIAVMESGKVRQIAPPAELYEFPNSRFVADFIGKMNLFEGKVTGAAGNSIVIEVKGLGRITVPYSGSARAPSASRSGRRRSALDRTEPGSDRVRLRGKVTEVAYFGDESAVFLENSTGVTVNVNVPNDARRTTPAFAIGDEMWLSWNPADTLVLTE